MNVNKLYPSKYMKASDVDEDLSVVIDRVEVEEIGMGSDKSDKPVLYFQGYDKGVVMNVTNKNAIESVYGEETDDWVGKPVEVFTADATFQGVTKPSIRIRVPKKKKIVQTAQPATQPAASDDVKAAKTVAYKAFIANAKKDDPNLDPRSLDGVWKTLCQSSIPGKESKDFTVSDWAKVERKINEPNKPFADDAKEFEEDDIPF